MACVGRWQVAGEVQGLAGRGGSLPSACCASPRCINAPRCTAEPHPHHPPSQAPHLLALDVEQAAVEHKGAARLALVQARVVQRNQAVLGGRLLGRVVVAASSTGGSGTVW